MTERTKLKRGICQYIFRKVKVIGIFIELWNSRVEKLDDSTGDRVQC